MACHEHLHESKSPELLIKLVQLTTAEGESVPSQRRKRPGNLFPGRLEDAYQAMGRLVNRVRRQHVGLRAGGNDIASRLSRAADVDQGVA